MKPEELKLVVQEKYGEIALQTNNNNAASCCGSGSCCGDMDYTVFSNDYSGLEGYQPDADLGLGCGLPTEFAGIQQGDHVLDLGSGAGNDCFVARTITGAEGHVTGLDFTDAMVNKARENLAKTGFTNIRFVQGDIEQIPLPDNAFDVVISNCVLNLVPGKEVAFKEIFRVLKPGGHFCISDIVLQGNLPDEIREAAEMYAGCISGAIQKEEYLDIITRLGFVDVNVHIEKPIMLPDDLLQQYIGPENISAYHSGSFGIISITVNASKP
ncbi:MAG: arsenite methyltransferase [Bacteroidales bacterium]|nr:arsenite methyltransferase [Bacteroidales bacterium]MDT8431591.1 arsenite methyltransferase [Bacteroidales bacterium]